MINVVFYILLLFYSVIVQLNVYSVSDEYLMQNIAMSLVKGGMSIAVLLLFFIHYNSWKYTNKNSFFLKLFKFFIYPFVVFFWSVKYEYISIFNVDILMFYFIFLYCIWVVFFDVMALYFFRNVELREIDKDMFFSQYPPSDRIDMLGLDAFICVLLVIPLIAPVDFIFK